MRGSLNVSIEKIKEIKPMNPRFTQEAKAALEAAFQYAKKAKQGYIGTEHILLGLLATQNSVAAGILAAAGVELQTILDMTSQMIAYEGGTALVDKKGYSPRAIRILDLAHEQAITYGAAQTGTEHLLLALLTEKENVAARMLNAIEGTDTARLYEDTLIAMGQDVKSIKAAMEKARRGEKRGGLLERYSRDLTRLAALGELDPVIGREEETYRLMQILSRRTKNNPCLVGEPGVGKTAVVEGLAARIVAGKVPPSMRNKRLLTLDLSGMVAGSKYRGEFEERIKKIIKEVTEDGNIILFLDELHTLIGAGGAEGAIDASNILKPSLARGELQLIGATTITEYRKYIEKDAALERRFQPVNVEAPTLEEAEAILTGIKDRYEAHHGVVILPEAIHAAVALSDRYINDRNLPDKAIDLIDEAAAAARLKAMEIAPKDKAILEEIKALEDAMADHVRQGDFAQAKACKAKQAKLEAYLERKYEKNQQTPAQIFIGEAEIAAVVSMWTKIPVTKLAEKETARLLALESVLHKRVIGQEEAVTAVAKAMRRGRAGLKDPNRPIGSFLFLGPTGVGKTELSKALAEAMFGSEDALIRVDMSEYMEGHSVSKMIGSPPGYVGFDEGGQLSEKVRRNPYSVVLFDEIEKAHPDVFNVLLQVLDDGHITDSKGRKVSFKNTVLIMTSNAGASRIIDPKNLGFAAVRSAQSDYEKMKKGVLEEVKKTFKPEFINRIDDMIVFHPLSREEMQRIVNLLAQNLADRAREQMGIQLSLTHALKTHLVEAYADEKMGARPLRRAMINVVEDALAEEILKGYLTPGMKLRVGFSGGQVTFSVL